MTGRGAAIKWDNCISVMQLGPQLDKCLEWQLKQDPTKHTSGCCEMESGKAGKAGKLKVFR